MVGMTFAVGCVDSPPQYSEPTRIPPQIVTNELDPPVSRLYVTDSATITFSIPFRADDDGQHLVARFVEDLAIGAPSLKDEVSIPADPLGRPFALQGGEPSSPSTPATKGRALSWPWTWMGNDKSGCHTITVVISEQSNFQGLFGIQDDLKEARATWFLWLRDSQPSSSDSKNVDCLQNNHTNDATGTTQ
jgi:hypothetical protein